MKLSEGTKNKWYTVIDTVEPLTPGMTILFLGQKTYCPVRYSVVGENELGEFGYTFGVDEAEKITIEELVL